MANVEKLLHGAPGGVDLLTQLEPTTAEDKLLKSAKTKIRDHLKKVISQATKERLGIVIVPRFFTQGSGAYKLLNRRAWMPPQRMDLDDGVYLPMTFVKGARPAAAAAVFFQIVDAALKQLIERERWDGFEEKDTCARVLVASNVHVDVPLYAIPDVEFEKLTKAALSRAIVMDSGDIDFMLSRKMKVDSWDELPSDKVLLAHRKDDWKPSDPRKIHEWFLAAVDFYGELLRRECRYLKAWRDYHQLDFISSLILMVDAWTVFREIGHLRLRRRDDLVLLDIAERLPGLFAGPVRNPAEPEIEEMLGTSWKQPERRAAIQAAKEMREELDMTINNCYIAESAVERMRRVFGDRVPNRPDLVGVHRAATAAVAASVPLIVPAPSVGRSTSG